MAEFIWVFQVASYRDVETEERTSAVAGILF